MDDWELYAKHTWGWRWLEKIWYQNAAIKPADMDGFVHIGGKLLMIDGKVTAGLPRTPTPHEIAVRKAKNLTILYLRADPAQWDEDSHEPRAVTHYYLKRGPFPAPMWNWDRWTPTTMEEVIVLCISWAAWADTVERLGL